MDSTSPPSYSRTNSPTPAQPGLHKNAKLEVGKSPSSETGRPCRLIKKNTAIDLGGETIAEEEFESLERQLQV